MRNSNTSRKAQPQWHWEFLRGLIVLTAFLPEVAQAIDPNRAMSQYIRNQWGTEQGFPRGAVYAITQTTDGYLWIGTEAGLVRFDGLNFRLVHDDSASFTITAVLGLVADNEGNLWVRLHGPTLLRYHDGVFDKPPANLHDPFTSITAMSLADRSGPLIFMMERGALTYRGSGFEMLAAADALPRSPVLSVAQTTNGEIWAGTRDAGLFRLSGGQTLSVTKGLPDLKINCLLPEGDGKLWVGTDAGIVRWNGHELTAPGIPAALNRFQALAIAKDRDSNVWVGSDSQGLLRFNARGFSLLNEGGGSSDAVTAVFEDREGSLWLGSASGLERLRDSAFVTYSQPEGVPIKGSIPVFADAESRVWFPSADGGLWWLKDEQVGRLREAGLDKDIVYSIAGGKGELWIGRQRGGLTHLRSKQGSYASETYTQAQGLAQNSVYSVLQTSDGAVWAGTLSGGVSKFSGGRFTTYTTADGLASNTVASILETSDGAIWFATPNGLTYLSKDKWHTYTVRDGLPADSVHCLLQDSTGTLWVGTANGLAFRGSSRFQLPARAPDSLREQILGLAEDGNGSLWVATSNHVLRVRRDHLLRGALTDGDVREYGVADGLRGVEGVKRHRSVVKDPRGRIWFSMNRGLSVVDPSRLTHSSAPAIVRIQTISADGNPMDLRRSLKVPAGSKRLTLGYAGLSLSIPERVRFRYWLEPFDRGWSEPITAREAVYTNLSPGPYRFRVIASNPDGVWNSQEAAVRFDIEPAIWQTLWFRLSAVLTFVLTVLAFYRLRLSQLAGQLSVRFEERLAERTRIAQELHDTLLQGFLSASMQLHVAVDRLPEDSPTRPPLSRILQLMGQVVEEGRNAVRGLRSSHTDLERAFSLVRQELGSLGEVDFRIVVEGQTQPLRPIIRDEVYRIGREALVNAFRHSGAGSIEIELEYAVKHFRVLVRDDGCGIDSRVLQSGREGHWGLSGMRERAEVIGARLRVWSGATGGTEVELYVPRHVAYELPLTGRLSNWFAKRTVQKSKNGKDE